MSQGFLNEMQTIIVGQVESMTRYELDTGNKGGALWVSKPSSGKNPNVLGREIMKIRMPFELFEQQRVKHESGEIKFPEQMEVLCEIDMGAQNRAVLTAISMKKHIVDAKPDIKSGVQK